MDCNNSNIFCKIGVGVLEYERHRYCFDARCMWDDFTDCGDELTVTWHLRESDIHSHCKFFSSTFVDDDGSLKIDPSVIQEFNSCESKNNCGRKKCH